MENPASMHYILDTFMILVFGVLVIVMYIGFTLFSAGLIRTKNTVTLLVQHIVGFAIMIMGYFLLSRHIINRNLLSYSTTYFSSIFYPSKQSLTTIFTMTPHNSLATLAFHSMLPCITLAIIIGVTCERLKFWAFFLFALLFITFIYPFEAYWIWGDGFLTNFGFIDKAGAGVVFLTGAISGLVGVLMLGPRTGKYGKDHKIKPLPGANLPLATLGLLFIWLGSIGFNAGVHYVGEKVVDIDALCMIFVNTLSVAASGLITALILARIIYGLIDLTLVANGALAGLASIAAMPTLENVPLTLLIGMIAAILVILSIQILEKLKIDDPTGMISVYGIGSIWGLIATAFAAGSNASHRIASPHHWFWLKQLSIQLYGIAIILLWVGLTSFFAWLLIKFVIGIRIDLEEERRGLDVADCGMSAYPEFN